MTTAFDDKSVNLLQFSSFFEEFPDGTERPIELVVTPVTIAFARGFISKYHYLQSMPDSTLFCYAGHYGTKLAGIIVFGMGGSKSRYTTIIPEIQNGEYCELTRLWCHDLAPKNTESRIISEALKMLPVNIKLVVSYADDGQGHSGIIYKATNWIYMGKTESGSILVDKNGKRLHPRLLGIYKMRHEKYRDLSDTELMKELEYTKEEGSFKHKYVYLRFGKVKNRFIMRKLNGKTF
jgi:hypothetical protein